MEKLNIPPGQWLASEGQIYPQETGKTLALIPYFDPDNKQHLATQELLAEAGTVANETGKTPRQILQERNELREAAMRVFRDALDRNEAHDLETNELYEDYKLLDAAIKNTTP